MIYRTLIYAIVLCAVTGDAAIARAQNCHREGDAITRPDGTRSSASPSSVIIGSRSSVRLGPGVLVGQGKGAVPLDDPNAPNKARCAILDGVSYCY